MRRVAYGVAVLTVACGGDDGQVPPTLVPENPPSPTSFAIKVTTLGRDLDRDGYLLRVDDGPDLRIGPEQTISFGVVDTGVRRIRLGDLAPWCATAGDSITEFRVRPGLAQQLTMLVRCESTFRGALAYANGSEIRFIDMLGIGPIADRLGFSTFSCAPMNCQFPSISPDGREVAFYRGTELMVGRAATGVMARRFLTSGGFAPVGWSPDGSRVVYVDRVGPSDPGKFALFVRSSTNGLAPSVQITPPMFYLDAPRWSLDGAWIVTSMESGSPAGGGPKLFLLRPDGSDLQPLATELAGSHLRPSWSADGTEVFFERISGWWTVGVNGGNVRQLGERNGSWIVSSPDGTHLAYQSWRNDGCESGVFTRRLSDGFDQQVSPWLVHPDCSFDHLATPTWGP